jgi:hypothetical protein
MLNMALFNWSSCYCIDTVGFDKEKIQAYMKYKEEREPEAE